MNKKILSLCITYHDLTTKLLTNNLPFLIFVLECNMGVNLSLDCTATTMLQINPTEIDR